MLLKGILESAGYRVKTAVDGLDAFTALRAETFDLLVSDVEMPRLNGFDLTAQIRADSELAELPVVLVTALESREDRERGIDVGANAYSSRAASTRATCSKPSAGCSDAGTASQVHGERATRIKVLVVDDSPVDRELLVAHLLDVRSATSQVVGAVARRAGGARRPDRRGHGRTWCRWTSTCRSWTASRPRAGSWRRNRCRSSSAPRPSIREEVAMHVPPMEAGAVACVEKPRGAGHAGLRGAIAAKLVQTVKADVGSESRAALARRVARRGRRRRQPAGGVSRRIRARRHRGSSASAPRPAGRPCCRPFSRGCPKDFPAPIAHRAAHRARLPAGLVEWLNQTTGCRCTSPRTASSLCPATPTSRPTTFTLGVGAGGRIVLAHDAAGERAAAGGLVSVPLARRGLRRARRRACCSPAWARTAPRS